jgi:hypothetical protein
MYNTLLNLFPNKMAIYFNVFGMFVVHWIGCNVNGNFAITEGVAGYGCRTCKSLSKVKSQVTSQQVDAIALYLDSVEDLKIVCCFLDFQETNASPMNTQ